jgi:hypothetical protein
MNARGLMLREEYNRFRTKEALAARGREHLDWAYSAAPNLSGALKGYIAAKNGDLPTSMAQLKPFLKEPLDDAILNRYEPIRAGNTNAPGFNVYKPILGEKPTASIDKTYDPRCLVGLTGAGLRGDDSAILPDQPGDGN